MLIDTKEKLHENIDKLCKMDTKQVVVIGGIVLFDNKVLVLKRAGNEKDTPAKWVLPSGKKGKFETSDEAVLRETFEETGIKTRISGPVSVFHYQVLKETEVRDTTQINYLLIPLNNPTVKLSEEHDNFQWIDLKESTTFEISDGIKKAIKSAFKQNRRDLLL